MSNSDRILGLIQAFPGSTDRELRHLSGVEPHQQVNQICRRLERDGLVLRSVRADGLIGNHPAGSAAQARDERGGEEEIRSPIPTYAPFGRRRPVPPNAMLVIPCSKRKREGGHRSLRGSALLDLLPPELSDRLAEARRRLATRASLDESRLLPACERYVGTFYRSAGRQLHRRVEAGEPVVIVSGAYGLALADEGVGIYDHRFSLGDWPSGLLEACLAAVSVTFERSTVLSLCGRSTDYAELVRRLSRRHGLEVVLAGASLAGRGGAQVLVPRCAGEALAAYDDGFLLDGWKSSDGVPVELEWLTHDD